MPTIATLKEVGSLGKTKYVRKSHKFWAPRQCSRKGRLPAGPALTQGASWELEAGTYHFSKNTWLHGRAGRGGVSPPAYPIDLTHHEGISYPPSPETLAVGEVLPVMGILTT